uniref:Uncharacterized protein n=1 Tax=Panagrolaimus sp. PS1159 TaxID=55785 RepID=A0AC35GJF5_9BILA
MATKLNYLNDNSKSVTIDNLQTVHDNRYSNLNLNQNLKCLGVSPIQSNSKSYNNKNCVSDNIEGRENPLHFNKSSKISGFSNPIKTENEELKKESETNNSFNGSKNKDLQKGKSDSIKNEISTDGISVIQNSFEFPRQENEGAKVPGVSSFKASQRLLNPNKASKNAMAPTTTKKVKKPFKPAMGKLPLANKVIIPCKDGKSFLINTKKLIQVTKNGQLQALNDKEVKLLEQACGQRKQAQQKRVADAAKNTAFQQTLTALEQKVSALQQELTAIQQELTSLQQELD